MHILLLMKLVSIHNSLSLFVSHTLTAIPCVNGTLRLRDGYSSRNGRLEVCVNEVWSTICGTDFTDELAGVACAALGASSEGL